ncbi:CPBP family intramembrane glutamic endopeptidase [Sphingomonas bacterium]|uniref:CPBP family intramembrane glutamic endopeptidase n=1 Tax=Sphingomonas bacterium TaxID=1895847 RepID=UPI0020C733D9|nr:CPBP family intramembrane glutamic endopeptidase [Sphingomonas bacterium]
MLTGATNYAAGRLTRTAASSLACIPTAAIPSLAVIAMLYVWRGDRALLKWRRRTFAIERRAATLAVGWLMAWIIGSIIVAHLVGGWITYAQGTAALFAFLVFGPIGEELLFRGLIWDEARAAGGSAARATAISVTAFSVHHLFLHGVSLPHVAFAQMAFAVPMGLVLIRLRRLTSSLWPPLLVHVATNLPAAF